MVTKGGFRVIPAIAFFIFLNRLKVLQAMSKSGFWF
jgi:hypothetical protein